MQPWQFAGLMITYACNARCAFCYVHGSPQHGGWMDPADAAAWWSQLNRVAARAGKPAKIHITGGEPFGDFERLCAILAAAQQARLGPVDKLETNAFWAADDGQTAEWLTTVRTLGVETLVISTDTYHQEFVPIEPVRRCARIAQALLGPDRVQVRWPEELPAPSGPPGDGQDRTEAFRRAQRRHRERLTGRAAWNVAPLLEPRPAEAFAALRCKKALLKGRHVHIDPYGNVFPGVCSGIVLGNARQEPLDQMWHRLEHQWCQNLVVQTLVSGGPVALMKSARDAGYEPLPQGYASKCHLCTHVRQWLFDGGTCGDSLGPAECYRLPQEGPGHPQ